MHLTYGILIFPSIPSEKFIKILLEQIKSIFDQKKILYDRILFEKNFFVIEFNNKENIIKMFNTIKNIIGIENFYITEIIYNTEFKILAKYIVDVGKKVVFEDQKFWINIVMSTSSEKFLEGDLQFYVTGRLIEILSKRNIQPAKNIQDANKIISCFICKNKTYISYESSKGLSGFPKNFRKEKIVSGIYDENSILATFHLIKLGFTPHIFFLFFDEEDLLWILKKLKNVFIFLGERKISLDLYHVKKIFDKEYKKNIMLELLYIRILFDIYTNYKLSLPYSYVVYPGWFIDAILDDCKNKNCFSPLISHTRNEIEKIFEEVNPKNLSLQDIFDDKFVFLGNQKLQFHRYHQILEEIFYKIKEEKKSISVNITPNYIHDIMDSI